MVEGRYASLVGWFVEVLKISIYRVAIWPENLEKSWNFSESQGKIWNRLIWFVSYREKIEDKLWLLRFKNALCKANRIMQF